jgi:hypothetical protein
LGILFALGTLAVPQASAWSSGPPDGFAGNPPALISCRACHGEAIGDGTIALLGLPAGYDPGITYTLTLELADPGQGRWGFELTPIDNATLYQAGTLIATDLTNTQLSDNPGPDPDYLKHTTDGTYDGVMDGPVTWSFDWTAPAAGDVTFYLAGNAANGNGSPSGDYIYLLQRPVSSATGVVPEPAPAVMFVGPSFPNPAPAGATAAVRFALGAPSSVVLRVIDAGGRFIAEPMRAELGTGSHLAAWNGRTADGRTVARGVYFFTLHAAGRELVTRLVID